MEETKARTDIRTLSPDELGMILRDLKQPAFRTKQIVEWVFDKNVSSFDEMTNIPKALREQLAEQFSFNAPEEIARPVSSDGSRKYLLRFSDGPAAPSLLSASRRRLDAPWAVCSAPPESPV